VTALKFDEIGAWSELKLEIIRKFVSAYSTIFSAPKQRHFHHLYIDAFAGPGIHLSKTSGELVAGSPLLALQVTPPFKEYHFIDLDGDKVAALQDLVKGRPHQVFIYPGDCNDILLTQIFPTIRYEEYRRALCLLDPNGLHLKWAIMQTAGALKTIDLLLNFPVMDIHRNVLWRHPERVDLTDLARMTAWWGDESWRQIAYTTQPTLFGSEEVKADIRIVADAFRDRLRTVAGFAHVPAPLPMRNSQNAIVYYLFFASHNPTAAHIMNDIFRRYGGGDRGGWR
jgi:three-Cys-motif partner protein